MDSPPPINKESQAGSTPPPPPPKIDLRQVVEGIAASDIGDYLMAIGVGLNAFKKARQRRKEEERRDKWPSED